MNRKECPPPGVIRRAGGHDYHEHHILTADAGQAPVALLLALLEGQTHATAVMPWGKPGPIRLPDERAARSDLIAAHLQGTSATVTYTPADQASRRIALDSVVLAALCPGRDGRCRWIGIDLDAAGDHGQGGLADAAHAARCIVERAAAGGLLSGLVVACSRRGAGRHVWLCPPYPVALADATIAAAALVAAAYARAAEDVDDVGGRHAFATANGALAEPGASGAVEITPQGTAPPALGWSLTLPAAGAHAAKGGGIIIDPFTERAVAPQVVPRCSPDAWATLVSEARRRVGWPPATGTPPSPKGSGGRPCFGWANNHSVPLHGRTEQFLAGHTPDGQRNNAAFAAACNLFAVGLPVQDVERLIRHGARGCRLPEREALSAIKSAERTVRSAH